jgi:transcriptional regulator PpsR
MADPTKPLTDLSRLSSLAPELASSIVSVASDIALVIDANGVIVNVASGAAPVAPGARHWLGRRWIDTVTSDTRNKIALLLDEVQAAGVTRRREVNHPNPDGGDVPVSWAAIRLGDAGPVVAVGRDLRAVAAIQQRLVDARQEIERDYWLGRQAESRFRLLFHIAHDAVMVLDGATLTVLEANQSAQRLFAAEASLVEHRLTELLPFGPRAAVFELLSVARTSGRPGEIRVRLGAPAEPHDLAATPFRTGDRLQLLLRARRAGPPEQAVDDAQAMAEFVEVTPDAVVLTDAAGRIRHANRAFAALVGERGEEVLRGRALTDVVSDAGGAWAALLVRTRSQGVVPRQALELRLGAQVALPVEVASLLLTEGDQECLGLTIRTVGGLGLVGPSAAGVLGRSLGEVVEQLGRQPLPALLDEIRAFSERHLVEAALVRASGILPLAADLLGIDLPGLERRMAQHRIEPARGRGPTSLN